MAGVLSNAFITDLLTLLFNNTNMANWGDATGIRGSTGAGSLYVSLHTADPGVGGNQTTSEAAYTSYTRVAVARTAGGWTIASQSVSPTSQITFPPGTGGGETCTFAAIGRDSSGAGEILARCQLSGNLVTGTGVTPILPTSSAFTMA